MTVDLHSVIAFFFFVSRISGDISTEVHLEEKLRKNYTFLDNRSFFFFEKFVVFPTPVIIINFFLLLPFSFCCFFLLLLVFLILFFHFFFFSSLIYHSLPAPK